MRGPRGTLPEDIVSVSQGRITGAGPHQVVAGRDQHHRASGQPLHLELLRKQVGYVRQQAVFNSHYAKTFPAIDYRGRSWK